MNMNPLDLTKDNFDQEVLECKLPVLVEFWATWCGHCRAFSPTIDKLCGDTQGKAKICKVEVDDNPELSSEYGINSIPTMIIVVNGEIVDTIVGATTEEELVDKLGV